MATQPKVPKKEMKGRSVAPPPPLPGPPAMRAVQTKSKHENKKGRTLFVPADSLEFDQNVEK